MKFSLGIVATLVMGVVVLGGQREVPSGREMDGDEAVDISTAIQLRPTMDMVASGAIFALLAVDPEEDARQGLTETDTSKDNWTLERLLFGSVDIEAGLRVDDIKRGDSLYDLGIRVIVGPKMNYIAFYNIVDSSDDLETKIATLSCQFVRDDPDGEGVFSCVGTCKKGSTCARVIRKKRGGGTRETCECVPPAE